MSVPSRYPAAALLAFAQRLLGAAGQPAGRARDIAEVLLEGDLLGHTTHGLSLLDAYLDEITQGRMPNTGEPEVVVDHGHSLTWDGHYLPGPWLVRRLIAEAQRRLPQHGTVTACLRRSHHIACLEAFLEPVARAGQLLVLTCSDPGNRWVVPPGGTEPCYSPNPIACGIPTHADPILVDLSLSTTSANACMRAVRTGQRLPGSWLADANGQPTDDPRPLVERREGGLYPLGGDQLGYKGFGLGLMVEALTNALGGAGRTDPQARWSCSVFLLLIDPARFGGLDAFRKEMSALAETCRSSRPIPGGPPVRLPGEAALRRRSEQLADGVQVAPEVIKRLRPWADRFAVPLP